MNTDQSLKLFGDLLDIIRTLRGPEGCPWDKKQTHQSLIPYMLEEAYEAVAAIEDKQLNELPGELGDVLLQIVLHAEIGNERQQKGEADGFDISTIIGRLCDKLVYRHPHVFSNVCVNSAEDVVQNWRKLKVSEKQSEACESILDTVSPSLPTLITAHKYQEKAALSGFDWDNIEDVLEKVKEELQELRHEIDTRSDPAYLEEEIGDLLFATVNAARFLNLNAEEALRKANKKFKRRFLEVEKAVGGLQKMKKLSLEELDLQWDKVKETEKQTKITDHQ